MHTNALPGDDCKYENYPLAVKRECERFYYFSSITIIGGIIHL